MAEGDELNRTARPSRGGWRYRRSAGLEFERMAFFTDAVFAIAMTLLIVSIDVPNLVFDRDSARHMLDQLADLGPQFFSFFLAFLLLGRYWLAHHGFVASLKSIDRTLMGVNMVYLAFIAFLPFPTALVGEYETNPMAVVLFAVCLGIISTLEWVFLTIAVRRGHTRSEISPQLYRYDSIQSLTPVALFAISIPIAFWRPTVALLSWLLAIPIGIWQDRHAPDAMKEYLDTMGPEDPPSTQRM
jgi:uncharacterized membrane protein